MSADSRTAILDRMTRILTRFDGLIDEPTFHEARMAYRLIPDNVIETLDGDLGDAFWAFMEACEGHGVTEEDFVDEGLPGWMPMYPHRPIVVEIL